MKNPKKLITTVHKDNRGFFKEIFKEKKNNKKFIFDCFSKSKKNVFRGLHLQTHKPQEKIITVTKGKIVDFAVDVRKKSKNFGKVYKFLMDENSNFSIYIPEGFAHGFLCLSNSCTIYYKCSNFRDAKSELSINYKHLNLKTKLILSKKDKNALTLKEIEKNLK